MGASVLMMAYLSLCCSCFRWATPTVLASIFVVHRGVKVYVLSRYQVVALATTSAGTLEVLGTADKPAAHGDCSLCNAAQAAAVA